MESHSQMHLTCLNNHWLQASTGGAVLEKLKEGIQGGTSHNVEMVANQNPKTFRQTTSAVRGRDTPRPHSKFTLPGRRRADSCLQQVCQRKFKLIKN